MLVQGRYRVAVKPSRPRREEEKEKTQSGPTGYAKDNVVLKGKGRFFFRFYLFLFSLEQTMMAHRFSINVEGKGRWEINI